MKNAETKPVVHNAMAFYHDNGLPAAWKFAMNFAGDRGRLATMPDIIQARLSSKVDELPWNNYFTTLTAEYCGQSKQGNPILIVAHGVGPMSTLQGAQTAYSWEYKDKTRNRKGGRITQDQFHGLESGKFGDVNIVDLNEYYKRYQYPFIQILRTTEALSDPVLLARLGPQAQQYIAMHTQLAREWHAEQIKYTPTNTYDTDKRSFTKYVNHRASLHEECIGVSSNPYIIEVEAPKYAYHDRDQGKYVYTFEEGYAYAHLVSIGGIFSSHHDGGESLITDISCHDWNDGTRFVGIKHDTSLNSGIVACPSPYKLIRNHWRDLREPVVKKDSIGFCVLMSFGDDWFTQYLKMGECLDTYDPEYYVISKKDVGEPVVFQTDIKGYYGFFQYAIRDVHTLAPHSANAYYLIGEPKNVPRDGKPMVQEITVQFCNVTADITQRIMRSDTLAHDYERMMTVYALGGYKS